ncbi:putative quinol monooxygenase [Paeniglutamicibacter psychrophenolicus]|uniref:Quinol monooxygenase YgiN n=1 Tax=Paeniglutamicibacter psychrophenolicus TaxID=257454 RepID=A0ABS4W8W4_9MICC|nr:antibiotic biosynthesis monooxygenase [Paeniglutamicibacter psychrophenolicus]MBP2372632.1 quinol monooxygenase YgiN [Paeniglutamicibacter psychrophenolicus]
MNSINLTGQLICQNDEEIAVVTEFLPRHIELTRAEPGCISFEVNQTDNPQVWDVAECFQNADSFALHQTRVNASEWRRATAGIKRSYSVTGL